MLPHGVVRVMIARFGHLPLPQIERVDVEAHHRAVDREGLSKASANHVVQLLRRLLTLAVSWELLERNPLRGIRLFTLENQVTTSLGDEEVDRLVAVLRSDRGNPMVCLILLFLGGTAPDNCGVASRRSCLPRKTAPEPPALQRCALPERGHHGST